MPISAVLYEKKFWARVAGSGPEECWEWPGVRSTSGYGRVMVQWKEVQAHRVAWEFIHGPIPDGLFVLHKCDNRACVNPAHLFLGTQKDNMRDMSAKGRGRKSPGPDYAAPFAKIDRDLASQIRIDYVSGLSIPALRRKYGFGISTLGRVVAGHHRKAEHTSVSRSMSEARALQGKTK